MKKSLSNGKLALIVVLSTVAVLAALAAYMLICVIQPNLFDDLIGMQVKDSLEEAGEVDFSRIIPGDWDTLYVYTQDYFHPNNPVIRDILVEGGEKARSANWEGCIYFLFVKDGALQKQYITADFRLPRSYISAAQPVVEFAREDARFVLGQAEEYTSGTILQPTVQGAGKMLS